MTHPDQRTSITFMDVLAVDVERYGPRDAVVLAALRQIGATSTVPVAVSAAKLGTLTGLSRHAAWRSLRSLHGKRAARVVRYHYSSPCAVRVLDVASDAATAQHSGQRETTQQDVGSISSPAHQIGTRLSTLRALLAVSG